MPHTYIVTMSGFLDLKNSFLPDIVLVIFNMILLKFYTNNYSQKIYTEAYYMSFYRTLNNKLYQTPLDQSNKKNLATLVNSKNMSRIIH